MKNIKEKGITLIALILTIIILLVLAGVTIKIVLDANFIEKTKTAVDQYTIAQYKEKMDLLRTSILINNLGNKEKGNPKDQIKEQLEKENWVTTVRTNTENEALEENQLEIITLDNYLFIIEITEEGEITYITEGNYDGEPYPKITLLEQLALEGTENEKTKIKITTETEKTKKTKNIEKIELIKNGTTIATKTYTTATVEDTFEIEESGTYTLKVTTNTGKTASKKITVIKIQGTTNKVTIDIEPKTPRNTLKTVTQNGIETGPIKVTIQYIENEQTNLQKQYSLDEGKTWINTNETKIEETVEENVLIIARYYDGKNSFNAGTYNIQNVDNIAPTIENYEITPEGTTITISNVTAKDTASEGAAEGEHPTAGIAKKLYSIDGTNYQEENTLNITEAKEYTIYVKAIDKAGNETIKNNKTITAYTITFNATGGEVTPASKIVIHNSEYGELPTPTKTGHTFKGWYTQENGGTQIQENQKVTEEQTLYARWEAGQHTLTTMHYLENANDNNYTHQQGKDTTETIEYGTNITLANKATTIENATYTKGSLEENGTETETQQITIRDDTTIHLYYNRDRYDVKLNKGTNIETVTVKATGEETGTATGRFKVGQSVTIEAKPATVAGHTVTWDGWTGTFENKTNPFIFPMPANNVTLTTSAVATAKTYTLTYDVNGGNALNPSSKTITFNQKYGDLPKPTRTNYTFEGWYTAESGGTEVTKDTVLTTEGNKKIYAHWKADKIESDGTIKTSTTKLLDGPYSYSNPPIPAGFRTLDTDTAKWESTDKVTVEGWNKGLVITDAANGVNGNEFVWVPVTSSTPYDKWCTAGIAYNNSSIKGDELPKEVTSEQTQIDKYHGFYIARYEAGIPTTLTTAINTATGAARNVTGTPVVKKDQVPWNYISYTKAKANAESMYKGTGTYNGVYSGLLTGKMWDTTMKWLQNANANVTTDCRDWGNYYDSTFSPHGRLMKTGQTTNTKKNNIYDLAGNVWEWTGEIYSANRVCRGGYFEHFGTLATAAYRGNDVINSTNLGFGFRVGLYIE